MGISYGTDQAVNTLLRIQNNVGPVPPRDIILLDGLTLIRNKLSESPNDTSINRLINQINDEIMLVIGALDTAIVRPTIIAFIQQDIFTIAPELHRRRLTKMASILADICEGFHTHKTYGHKLQPINDSETSFGIYLKPRAFPHVSLYHVIRDAGLLTPGLKAGVLTSTPYVLHLHSNIPDLISINSYTGSVLHPKDFGKKVFGLENVLFTKETHVAFGDKLFVRGIIKYRARLLNGIKGPITHKAVMAAVKREVGPMFKQLMFIP